MERGLVESFSWVMTSQTTPVARWFGSLLMTMSGPDAREDAEQRLDRWLGADLWSNQQGTRTYVDGLLGLTSEQYVELVDPQLTDDVDGE